MSYARDLFFEAAQLCDHAIEGAASYAVSTLAPDADAGDALHAQYASTVLEHAAEANEFPTHVTTIAVGALNRHALNGDGWRIRIENTADALAAMAMGLDTPAE